MAADVAPMAMGPRRSRPGRLPHGRGAAGRPRIPLRRRLGLCGGLVASASQRRRMPSRPIWAGTSAPTSASPSTAHRWWAGRTPSSLAPLARPAPPKPRWWPPVTISAAPPARPASKPTTIWTPSAARTSSPRRPATTPRRSPTTASASAVVRLHALCDAGPHRVELGGTGLDYAGTASATPFRITVE